MLTRLTAANIKTFYETNKDAEVADYLGDILFPVEKQEGLELRFIKGRNDLPIVLKPSAFDTNVTLRDRPVFEEIRTDMPFFKEAVALKEEHRQELLKLSGLENKAYLDAQMVFVFKDRAALIDGALAQIERMRMQLLSRGSIGIAANGLAYEYDYGFNEKDNMVTLTADDAWDKETSDPIGDIEAWKLKMRNANPELLIMTTGTWGKMKRSKQIQAYIGGTKKVTNSELKEYIKTEYGLDIVLYDKVFMTEEGESKQFFPDGVVTLAPKQIGNTYFGTTPEEADLMSGVSDAKVEIVETGVAITTTTKSDPVNVLTKVSEIVLPSFEAADSVFIANVFEDKVEEVEG